MVTEFFDRDETLAHLSFARAEMLSARTPGNSKRVASFAQLLAIYIAEKYTNIASEKPDYHGGLPIARLRKAEDYVRAHLAESRPVENVTFAECERCCLPGSRYACDENTILDGGPA